MLEIKAREVRAKYPVYSGEDENLNGTASIDAPKRQFVYN
jgi:hypothetical protein